MLGNEVTQALPARGRGRLSPAALKLYNALYWPYLALTCMLLFFPALVLFVLTAWWDPRRRWLRRYTTYWGAHYLTAAPLAGVRVRGREHVKGLDACIFVVNHQSMCDILAIYATHFEFAWVSKQSNFFAPFLGWNMWLNGYVPLKRGRLASIRKMLRTCERMLRGGQSLCVFPEGTRSRDGQLRSFFRGAFWLSVRTGAPIVPIVIDGTREIIAKNSVSISPSIVDLHVLAPIDPAAAHHDSQCLRELVRNIMADELAQMRGGVAK